MKIQEIIDNLITIKEYYTPERDFSQFGYDYELLTEEENEAIENAIGILEIVKTLPNIEPKTGEWVYGEHDIPHCSECGMEIMDISEYCPCCGARMEVESK